jgi:hypothetical protein
LRRTVSALLTNPSVLAGQLLYVRQTDVSQLLEIGGAYPGAGDHVLYRLGAPAPHDSGHEPGYSHVTRTQRPPTATWTFWTTALSASRAYVTLLPRRVRAQPRIVSLLR